MFASLLHLKTRKYPRPRPTLPLLAEQWTKFLRGLLFLYFVFFNSNGNLIKKLDFYKTSDRRFPLYWSILNLRPANSPQYKGPSFILCKVLSLSPYMGAGYASERVLPHLSRQQV